ncbi:PIN-like domain-containing protein [Actinomadura geliboluensis]|uniref:PIN-like domain-containing protein n=1 Tax=Actinomadura geliboluensis TaxID=882440 RepID=UPI0037204684
MSTFRSSFEEFYLPSEGDRKNALLEGLVCLDTNVLLDAYRFAPIARNELLTSLKLFENRLWIPHQVALEFHKNRVKVISKQGQAYKALLESLNNLKNELSSDVLAKAKSLRQTIAAPDAKPESIIEPITQGLGRVIERVNALQSGHGITLDQLDSDPVLSAFEEIFNGRVGDRLDEKEEAEARKEADRRVKAKIPPGYKDVADKDDPSGDYLLWKQLLLEAKTRKLPILFVTRDVKEDWFRREAGRTLSARPELIKEAREVADVSLIIMETKSFLWHVKQYMTQSAVSNDLLRQVEELPPINRPKNEAGLSYERAVVSALLRSNFTVQESSQPVIDYDVTTPNGLAAVAIRYFPPGYANVERRFRDLRQEAQKFGAPKLLLITNAHAGITRKYEDLVADFNVVTWDGAEDDIAMHNAVLRNSSRR